MPSARRFRFRTQARRLFSIGATLSFLALTAPRHARAQTDPSIETVDASIAHAWFALSGDLVRITTGYSPPVASRALGYLGVTLYEAVVPAMPGYQSLGGALKQLPPLPPPLVEVEYDWQLVANTAMASMMRSMFATFTIEAFTNLQEIDALEQQLGAALSSDAAVRARSIERGRTVADAIFAWSRTDGGAEGYRRNTPITYYAPVGPGSWVPTWPTFQGALQPAWGKNRTFLAQALTSCDPPPPPAYSEDANSAFFDEALEVYDTVNGADAEQVAIAMFWSDDPFATSTPPGHSFAIATQLLEEQEASLGVAAEVYARLGIAVADAFIATWRVKYQHNLLRPITFIERVIDPNWTPLLITPSFPVYPSGHSVQSSATAAVLGSRFSGIAFEDHSRDALGLAPRTYTDVHAAAEEAGISRLYGGIHYRSAIENGLVQGACIGALVNALPMRVPVQ